MLCYVCCVVSIPIWKTCPEIESHEIVMQCSMLISSYIIFSMFITWSVLFIYLLFLFSSFLFFTFCIWLCVKSLVFVSAVAFSICRNITALNLILIHFRSKHCSEKGKFNRFACHSLAPYYKRPIQYALSGIILPCKLIACK